MKRLSKKTHELTLEFDSKRAAENFWAHWLDGGGESDNLDLQTVKWNKSCTRMRIKGTGYHIEWVNCEMVVMTPEMEARLWDEWPMGGTFT